MMMFPPNDVSPRALFLKLIERPYPSEVVPFPRLDANGKPICMVRIRVLPFEEHEAAQLAAEKRIRNQFTAEEYAHAERTASLRQIIDDAVTAEMVSRVVVAVDAVDGSDPPVYPTMFINADEVRRLTPDEVSLLFSMYLMVQARFGPYEGSFRTEDEIKAWVTRLTDGASAFPLAQIGSRQRDELLLLLATRSSILYSLLDCPPENLPTLLESLRTSLATGTGLSSPHAADFASFPVSLKEAIQLRDELRS
jgi:hypothetical protein